MPRYKNERGFQLGEYWLSKQSRSDAWCRTWFDTDTRQTKRVSLRTSNFEEAKQILTDWFVLYHTKQDQNLDDAVLAEVLARYYEHHGSKLRSTHAVKRFLHDWVEFHKDATVKEACAKPRQEAFQRYLAEERGLSANSVRHALKIGKGALNWAWKRGEISSVPYIDMVKVPQSPPKGRPMEISEIAELLEAAGYHLKAFIIMMVATAGRNKAILDLTFTQIDFSNNLIDLNPAGREQTHKYRPKIKLPASIKVWLQTAEALSESGYVVEYLTKPPSQAFAVAGALYVTSWKWILRFSHMVSVIRWRDGFA